MFLFVHRNRYKKLQQKPHSGIVATACFENGVSVTFANIAILYRNIIMNRFDIGDLHGLVTRLDYCANCEMAHLPAPALAPLQSVINAAARLIVDLGQVQIQAIV